MIRKGRCLWSVLAVVFPLLMAACLASCESKPPQKKPLVSADFVIDWEPGIDYIGYYIAKINRHYQDVGIDIEFKHVNGAPLSSKLIGSGKAFIGTTTADQLIIANAGPEQLPIKAIATIFATNPAVIVSHPDRPIRKFEELKGKRLGMNAGSVTYKQFKLIADKRKIKGIKEIDIGWGGTEQLLSGEIDALLAYSMERPVALELKLNREPVRLWLNQDPKLNIIGQVIAIHAPTFSDSNKKDLIMGIVRASLKGWADVQKNKDLAIDQFIKEYPMTDRKYARRSLDETLKLLPKDVENYKIKDSDWVIAIDAMKQMNMVEGSPNPNDFFVKF